MLTDPEEIALAAQAREPGIREPNRDASGLDVLLSDFFGDVRLTGAQVLELGPGHYEFAQLLADRGARLTVVENDPPVAQIGKRRGFKVVDLDIRELAKHHATTPYNGVFSKGSTNPFWFYGDREALDAYVSLFERLTTPDGWVWIVSCPYLLQPASETEVQRWLDVERDIYTARGYSSWEVRSAPHGAVYGISVPCRGLRVYTRNLPTHRWRAKSLSRLAYFTARRWVRNLLRGRNG